MEVKSKNSNGTMQSRLWILAVPLLCLAVAALIQALSNFSPESIIIIKDFIIRFKLDWLWLDVDRDLSFLSTKIGATQSDIYYVTIISSFYLSTVLAILIAIGSKHDTRKPVVIKSSTMNLLCASLFFFCGLDFDIHAFLQRRWGRAACMVDIS